MSLAGARSARGDEYQLRVAMQWIVRLWTDEDVAAVQVESLGMPDDEHPPPVDDVVVELTDGRRIYIQAKKNHPDYKEWSLKDPKLRSELTKARNLLETPESSAQPSRVLFVSRSPFGKLQKLAEGTQIYSNFETFSNDAQTL